MTKTLTPEDIRDLLTGFVAAIELDQIRVDALPPEKFHPAYSDSMWRNWRRHHIDYINRLLLTVNTIPSALLQELARLAITFEPAVVQETVLDLFADATSGSCAEELETAEHRMRPSCLTTSIARSSLPLSVSAIHLTSTH